MAVDDAVIAITEENGDRVGVITGCGLGGLRFMEDTIAKLIALANQLCDGRLVATLEGGYNLSILGKLVTSAIARMAGSFYRLDDSHRNVKPLISEKAEQIINSVRSIQSSYWKL